MNCTKTKKDLVAYLDGELADGRATAVRDHLERCPACRLEAERLSASGAILDEIADIEPSSDFLEKVIAGAKSSPAPVSNHGLLIVRRFAAVAAALIIIAVTFWLAWPGATTSEQLSPEEQEIVKNMEVLENMELLENMDLLTDLELLLKYEEEDFESS